jgi:hypothetical protein
MPSTWISRPRDSIPPGNRATNCANKSRATPGWRNSSAYVFTADQHYPAEGPV